MGSQQHIKWEPGLNQPAPKHKPAPEIIRTGSPAPATSYEPRVRSKLGPEIIRTGSPLPTNLGTKPNAAGYDETQTPRRPRLPFPYGCQPRKVPNQCPAVIEKRELPVVYSPMRERILAERRMAAEARLKAEAMAAEIQQKAEGAPESARTSDFFDTTASLSTDSDEEKAKQVSIEEPKKERETNVVVGGFAPPPPGPEFLPLHGGWMDPKYPPDLPNDSCLQRRREDMNRAVPMHPIPWDDIEGLIEQSSRQTEEFRQWVLQQKSKTKLLRHNYVTRSHQLKYLMTKTRKIERSIDKAYRQIEDNLKSRGILDDKTSLWHLSDKDWNALTLPMPKEKREYFEMLFKKNKEIRERIIPIEVEFLELREQVVERNREIELKVVGLNKYHPGERVDIDDDSMSDGPSDQTTPTASMSEVAKGKQPMRPAQPNISTSARKSLTPPPKGSDQSGTEITLTGRIVTNSFPAIEDIESESKPPPVPDWFRYLDDEDIIPLYAEDEQDRFRELLNKVVTLGEAAALATSPDAPKPFNKYWHRSGPWQLHQRRKGWWGRCRRGPDVSDPLENTCELCHGPVEQIEIIPAPRVQIVSKITSYLTWTEPEPLDPGPVFDVIPKINDLKPPVEEQYENLMACIEDAQKHVAEEDKRVALAMMRKERRQAEAFVKCAGWKSQGGFLEPTANFKGDAIVAMSPREASRSVPFRRRPKTASELLGPIVAIAEAEQEKEEEKHQAQERNSRLKRDQKKEQWNVGRNRLVYGQQEGQVWDATAHDRREKARAVGRGSPFERSLRATLSGAGVKPI